MNSKVQQFPSVWELQFWAAYDILFRLAGINVRVPVHKETYR